jgi:hypothetical protein
VITEEEIKVRFSNFGHKEAEKVDFVMPNG